MPENEDQKKELMAAPQGEELLIPVEIVEGLPIDCPSRDEMVDMLAHGASIDDLWNKRCSGCDLEDGCPFAEEEYSHHNKMEMALLNHRISSATLVLGSVITLMSILMILDFLAQSRSWNYHIPVWFINVFEVAITSALVTFSAGALLTIGAARDKRLEVKKGDGRSEIR